MFTYYYKDALPIREECDRKIEAMHNKNVLRRNGDHLKVPANINWFEQYYYGDYTYQFECPENLIHFDGKQKFFSDRMTNLRSIRIDVLPELKNSNLIKITCHSSETTYLPEGLIVFHAPSSVVNKMKFPSTLKSLIVTYLNDPLNVDNLPLTLEEFCICTVIDFSIFKDLKHLSIIEPQVNLKHLKVPETVKTLELVEFNCKSLYLPDSLESLILKEVPEDIRIEGGKNVKYMEINQSIDILPSVESFRYTGKEYELTKLMSLKNLKEIVFNHNCEYSIKGIIVEDIGNCEL